MLEQLWYQPVDSLPHIFSPTSLLPYSITRSGNWSPSLLALYIRRPSFWAADYLLLLLFRYERVSMRELFVEQPPGLLHRPGHGIQEGALQVSVSYKYTIPKYI